MKDQNKEHLIFIALLFAQLSVTTVIRLITDMESQRQEMDTYWILGTVLMLSFFVVANWYKKKNAELLGEHSESDEALYAKLRSQYIIRLALMEGAVILNLVFSYIFQNEFNLYNALAGVLLYVLMKQSPEERIVFDKFK